MDPRSGTAGPRGGPGKERDKRLHLYTLRQRISPAAIVEEAGKFANEVIAPLNRVGDTHGALFKDGAVTMPPGWKEAYRNWAASLRLERIVRAGGPLRPQRGADRGLERRLEAFGLGPLLTMSAMELIAAHTSPQLQATYLPQRGRCPRRPDSSAHDRRRCSWGRPSGRRRHSGSAWGTTNPRCAAAAGRGAPIRARRSVQTRCRSQHEAASSGWEAHLAILVAPHEAHGKAAADVAPRCFVADAARAGARVAHVTRPRSWWAGTQQDSNLQPSGY